jgi:hypothetical protein
MNGAPVSILHGAPLRLRCENWAPAKVAIAKIMSPMERYASLRHTLKAKENSNERDALYNASRSCIG